MYIYIFQVSYKTMQWEQYLIHSTQEVLYREKEKEWDNDRNYSKNQNNSCKILKLPIGIIDKSNKGPLK